MCTTGHKFTASKTHPIIYIPTTTSASHNYLHRSNHEHRARNHTKTVSRHNVQQPQSQIPPTTATPQPATHGPTQPSNQPIQPHQPTNQCSHHHPNLNPVEGTIQIPWMLTIMTLFCLCTCPRYPYQ